MAWGARTDGDELTWIEDAEVRTCDGCLLRLGGNAYRASWNGAGDVLLLDYELDTGQHLVGANGARRLEGNHWEWLGETSDLITGGDGPVRILRADGSVHRVRQTNGVMTFATSRDGRWLVGESIVDGVRGLHRIELANGQAERLASVEERAVAQVALASDDDVVFVEDVGERSFLRRRDARTGATTVLAESSKRSGLFMVLSPFDPTALAWTTGGGCGGPPTVSATGSGRSLRVEGVPTGATPEAWLRDGTLLLIDNGQSCDASPGTLWSFRDGRARLLGERVQDVAVRPTPPT